MKPFPWKCRTCEHRAVSPATLPYTAEVEHDGRAYTLRVPALDVLHCADCGAVTLDDAASAKLTEALGAAAGLLTASQIRQGREEAGLTAKQLAALLDVAEATVARWEAGAQLPQRAMDKLLRGVFEVPEFRRYLGHRSAAPPPPTLAPVAETTTPA